MASRNLTKTFVGIRNAQKANKSLRVRMDIRPSMSSDDGASDSGLLNASDSTPYKSVKDSLPPVWVDKIEKTEEDIAKIQSKSKFNTFFQFPSAQQSLTYSLPPPSIVRELSALHTKRLIVNFEADEALQEREIDLKTQEITDLFRHAESLLKRFAKQGDEGNISDAEVKVRKNMQSSIAKRLQSLSFAFRTSQKEYMGRLQNQKSGGGAQAFDFLSADPSKSSINGDDQGFTSAQMSIVSDMEMFVDERDQEIGKIAKSIEDLATIFKELAVLIIDQGTILDRIDYNMEAAVEHAKEGNVQLVKAETNQKNALPLRCIIVLVVLIAIMLGVLVWKHQRH